MGNTMRLLFVVTVLLLTGLLGVGSKKAHSDGDFEDNEFAEFEDFDDEEEEGTVVEEDAEFPSESESQGQAASAGKNDDDDDDEEEEDEGVVETEDDEFDHMMDEEEFIGFDRDTRAGKGKPHDVPDLKIAKMLMLAGLGVYFLNFLAGKTKNSKLAQAWFTSHKTLLDENFSLVGDDGTSKEVAGGTLMKESENIYTLWCSGRTCVEGMLVELKLIKRQDLINVMATLLKPLADQISQFAEKKGVEKYNIPSSFQMLSEIPEASSFILDKRVCSALEQYESQIEYIHISDQYSGPKNQYDDAQTKMPEVTPSLVFCFNVPGKGKTRVSDIEGTVVLMKLVFYCVDKARTKAERNRQKAEEAFLKLAHSQRQEAAQQRREEKRRQEKERIMNEEDPDRARKLEEKESKRDMKRKQARTKMMKVKGILLML
ncbi:CCD47-like protein [Mya arenaria]|uniref:PAT complex subunit CCDC47 n=1 Tax=Mya arenaria TaxID=6604 RepID=A0ABY7DCV8_MYAAR|nr:CCD47-like protein [Mya arenaria]